MRRRISVNYYCNICIVLYLYIYIASQSVALPVRGTHAERREQFSENEERHLADQLIKWIVSKELGSWLQ